VKHCILVDIDGTVADSSRRLAKYITPAREAGTTLDWLAFFCDMENDPPILPVIDILKAALDANPELELVFSTGRPDTYELTTEAWLRRYFDTHAGRWSLMCRRAGDRRNDDIIKREIVAHVRGLGIRPIMAFDDRARILKMYQREGIIAVGIDAHDF